MTTSYLQLRRIGYTGPKKRAEHIFCRGVNVICGASDTGKSFLAESIDFMLGGSELRDIPERTPYGEIQLDFEDNHSEKWRFSRATMGGNFRALQLKDNGDAITVLRWRHGHGRTDNVSGFLLDKIGLTGKRILRSKAKGTTQSLSFRNLARLVIVQEGEIQQIGSPFWGGQYTLKTAEMAAIKLLLTGVDDSSIVSTEHVVQGKTKQIEIIDELLADIEAELSDIGEEKEDLEDQLTRLNSSIEARRESLDAAQRELDELLAQRREMVKFRTVTQGRIDEIGNLLARFDLLLKHYDVDEERLRAIQEGGSMFAHVAAVACPLCGALPDAQKHEEACDGDVEAIVEAATAEITKIERLRTELRDTVGDLRREAASHEEKLASRNEEYLGLNTEIQETVSPNVAEERVSFSVLIEKRASVKGAVDIFGRAEDLRKRKRDLEQEDEDDEPRGSVLVGLPDSVAHEFSLKVSSLLKNWDFPGVCLVHFDKETTDFVIDGKPRASRGKGLRAITHAAVTISLLEFCQEHDLPHPGFVVLDSPLLAYFKPEGDDDMVLQGTRLKERFYEYLISHHVEESQVIVIENQHPPDSVLDGLNMTVFTGNPNEGRQGFL